MRIASSAVVLAVVVALVTTAQAQSNAPGVCECVVLPRSAAQPHEEPWQQHRLGVMVRFGSLGADQRDASGAKTESQQFSTAGLNVRYRWLRRIEWEFGIDRGIERREDGQEGELVLVTATASVLFRMRPHAHWDWYLLAGLGGSERTLTNARAQAADARAHAAFGVGVERRFDHLVLGIDLRALAMERGNAAQIRGDEALATTSGGAAQGSRGAGQLAVSLGWYF
jgi:hypothetical protein